MPLIIGLRIREVNAAQGLGGGGWVSGRIHDESEELTRSDTHRTENLLRSNVNRPPCSTNWPTLRMGKGVSITMHGVSPIFGMPSACIRAQNSNRNIGKPSTPPIGIGNSPVEGRRMTTSSDSTVRYSVISTKPKARAEPVSVRDGARPGRICTGEPVSSTAWGHSNEITAPDG